MQRLLAVVAIVTATLAIPGLPGGNANFVGGAFFCRGGGTIGAIKVALYRKLPYRPLEDFEYLALINEVPMTLIGRSQLPVTTYRDFEKIHQVQWCQAQHRARWSRLGLALV